MSDALTLDARAKVNLRLRIFPPAPDGYHPIETVFCRISLHDRVRLRLREGSGVRLIGGGAPAPAPAGRANLAARAAEAWLRATGKKVAVEIALEKAIPQAAGLGGGSSDAAAVLRGLNELLGDPLPTNDLLAVAAGLGADVPFFVLDVPMAFGRGRGDRLEPLDPLPPSHALVARPNIQVSTADAYRAWDGWVARRGSGPRAPAAASEGLAPLGGSWEEAAEHAENDFEPVIFELHPELVDVKRRLLETGPHFALLSGSGSSFFAPFPTEAARDAALEAFKDAPTVEVFPVTAPE